MEHENFGITQHQAAATEEPHQQASPKVGASAAVEPESVVSTQQQHHQGASCRSS